MTRAEYGAEMRNLKKLMLNFIQFRPAQYSAGFVGVRIP